MSREVDAYVVNFPADLGAATDPAAAVGEHLLHYPSTAGWAVPEPCASFRRQAAGVLRRYSDGGFPTTSLRPTSRTDRPA